MQSKAALRNASQARESPRSAAQPRQGERVDPAEILVQIPLEISELGDQAGDSHNRARPRQPEPILLFQDARHDGE